MRRASSRMRSLDSSDRLRAAVSGSASVMYSGACAATTACCDAGAAMVQRPTPLRSAARPASTAAPVLPSEPATTSRWPKRPLWASRSRGGKSGRTSAASRRQVVMPRRASSADTPMSPISTAPACAAAGASSRLRLSPAKVTVRQAFTVGPRQRAAIRVEAGRQVERDDRHAGGAGAVDGLDGRGHRPARGAAQAGTEKRVHDQIGAAEDRREPARIRDLLDAPAPAPERVRRVAPHVGAPPHQQHAHHRAAGSEPARDHESITAVVALAAHDDDRLAADRREPAGDERGRAGPRVIHEARPGNAELADGARVERPHLRGGEDGQHGVSG